MNYKGLLKSYSLLPRKRFSQNFLTDKNVAIRIIECLGLSEGDTVIEIGPGLGILTEGLLGSGARVIAIEIDRDLAGKLRERFRDCSNLEIISADALKISYKELAAQHNKRLKLVSNLPYNISTPIIFKLLEEREIFSMFLFMLQKEVAQRIVSPSDTKEYGILSVMVQLLADVKLEFDVPPSSFYPIPKVNSSVVRFNILDKPRVDVGDVDFFKKVVKASFGQRRKTLLNALKLFNIKHTQLVELFNIINIDPKRRGETLTLEEFAILSSELKKLQTKS
ncbi:MAG: 16S rRNA (adenine(1518)-N(6)/adenine(1519)-N(6))-dimethyltransferase RsmA [Deltaproteobacteria bacterium]|nr:16S rRNA (adenine(1518)-N(6)/adenine(1519)-N(6))-dimethyltransferase RsmA [Deltaproteobacteria bacterium]